MKASEAIFDGFETRLREWGAQVGVTLDWPTWWRGPKLNASRNTFLLRASKEILLQVHVSTSEPGFWGVNPNRLSRLQASGREWVVVLLLRSPDTGYLVSSAEAEACTRSGIWPLKKGLQHKVHERTVGEELCFNSFTELANRLARRVGPKAPPESSAP
jgi:hypothetical protein